MDILRPAAFDFHDLGGGEDFRLFIGQPWAWQLDFTRTDGLPLLMDGDAFLMQARGKADDQQVAFELSAGEITATGPLLSGLMSAAQTAGVRPGDYVYGIRRTIAATGEVRPFLAGGLIAAYFPAR